MNSPAQDNHGFLSGGGEMGEIIRAYDWGNSSLGKPATWPQSLKTAVRLLLSNGHPMFIWWGPDLIQFYNDAYRRSIGPERHPSAIGQQGHECWAEIWDIIGPQIKQVMSGGGSTWHENQLVPITRNGKREDVYWTYSYSPIDDQSAPNGTGGVLVVCTETTEQVLSEQRKKAAEERWRELFNQAPGFMCILNGPQHTFEFANPSYFQMIGNRELIGRTVADALPEVKNQGFEELLDKVYRTGEAFKGLSIPITLTQEPEGSPRDLYLDFVYQPIRNSNGEVTGIFVDGYDVTERVRTLNILRTEDRRKDEFLAMLAHELRNPLAPILNASALLTQTSLPHSNEHVVGELISRQATQLNHLINDLLDVSRITQGKIELQRETLELNNIIKFAIESSQPLLKEKQHDVIYTDEANLFINGDATRIVQSLVNVLNNAAKYTEAKGRIEIHLKKINNTAMIEISDNGIGITPEVLPNVFDLFVQADRALDRSQGGLGIGLSIVRRLIQMHDGSVTAISKGIGQGATFQICLPLVESLPITILKPEKTALSSLRILVVDDNIDAADSLTQLLQLKGHETATAYTAHEALSATKTFDADVVLLDIGLPDTDGYEVARQLRAEQNDNVLIALTGYGQADDIRKALEAGFNEHVTKPIAFDALEQLLEKYCTLQK